MIVPTESYSTESSEFFAMIKQMISSASFSDYLKFICESNIPPSAGLDVWPPRHHRYIIFSSLRIMLRVPTALHLLVYILKISLDQ